MKINLLVTISETSELLLAGGIPDVESNGTVVGVEDHGVDFDSESSNVLLFEFSGQMSLNEGSLTDSTVSNEN